MICTVGEESWRQKESRSPDGVPPEWGDFATRAVIWEIATAVTLLQSGADIVVLRHPAAIDRVKQAIDELMTGAVPEALAVSSPAV